MNYRNAYNGLAATYRNLRKKAAKIATEYGLLKEKYDVLSAKDPQLAYYIDENYRLSTEVRTLGEAVAEAKRQADQATTSAEILRKAVLKREQELEKANSKYKYTFIAWALGDAVLYSAILYKYVF